VIIRATVLCWMFLLMTVLEPAKGADSATKHPLAPSFSLVDQSGRPLNLSNYKGKVVLLDFWATWCEPCRLEAPKFVSLVDRYHAQGLAVIGISLDESMGAVREFYNKYKLNYPVALGNDQLSDKYGGIFGLPTAFVIGRDGRIYARHVGAVDTSVFETEIRELLPKSPTVEFADFRPAEEQRPQETIEPENAQELASDLPGVDLTKLTDTQKQAFLAQLETQKCTCGCKMSVPKCRVDDSQCAFSLRLAREARAEFARAHP
jgi:peroxiredoxin